MGPGRQNISLWKSGQDHQTLERDDWQLRVDPERRLRRVWRPKYFVFARRRHDRRWVLERKNSYFGHCHGRSKAIVEGALRLVRFFFSSNFLPLPEFLRVLNHLIENGRVRSVAWSPDGNCMASGSYDKTIKVWNTKTGQCQSTLTGHRYTLFLCFGTNNFPNRCTFLE